MTPSQVISLVADHFVLVGTSDATNTTWRRRIEEWQQETVEEIFDEYAWTWKQETATPTLVAGDLSVEAPANFSDIGENGGVYLQGLEERLEYLPPHDLFRLQELNGTTTGRPSAYTLAYEGGNGGPLINFDVTADQDYVINLYYDLAPPLTMDKPSEPTLTEGTAGNPNGTYSYKIVFINSDTVQSDASDGEGITVSSKKVVLTNIQTGSSSVIARGIYRTEAGGSTYKLVTTLNDNTTTTYTDDTADGSLGATITGVQSLSIPRQFHRSVLAKGVMARAAKHLGKADAVEYEAAYRAELARMKARRTPGSESLQRLGDFGLPTYGMH